MWNLKYGTNEPIYKPENRLRDHTYGRGVGGREWAGNLRLVDANYYI